MHVAVYRYPFPCLFVSRSVARPSKGGRTPIRRAEIKCDLGNAGWPGSAAYRRLVHTVNFSGQGSFTLEHKKETTETPWHSCAPGRMHDTSGGRQGADEHHPRLHLVVQL